MLWIGWYGHYEGVFENLTPNYNPRNRALATSFVIDDRGFSIGNNNNLTAYGEVLKWQVHTTKEDN